MNRILDMKKKRNIQFRPTEDRPIRKLTVSLIETYEKINETYFDETQLSQQVDPASKIDWDQNVWDDEDGDYIITSGELVDDRYIIKEQIGKGSFGVVARAVDTVANVEVAIKIIKSKKQFWEQAQTEIDLLSSLSMDADEHNVVCLLRHFTFRKHKCLVFEMLSINLYELLRNSNFTGISLDLVRTVGKQVLKSLALLSSPGIGIIHCDLKPENILLQRIDQTNVKIIDFGSSCKSSSCIYSYIQSRFYRAPEVMLGLPYSHPIDMWSLGCTLFELYTGEPLFSGSDHFDQIQEIIAILGPIPRDMIAQTHDYIRKQIFEKGHSEESAQKYEPFVDLIYRMLTYDPRERISPFEAQHHPFFTHNDSFQNILDPYRKPRLY